MAGIDRWLVPVPVDQQAAQIQLGQRGCPDMRPYPVRVVPPRSHLSQNLAPKDTSGRTVGCTRATGHRQTGRGSTGFASASGTDG